MVNLGAHLIFLSALVGRVLSGEDIPDACKKLLGRSEKEDPCCNFPEDPNTEEEVKVMTYCYDKHVERKEESQESDEDVEVAIKECIDECIFNMTGLLTSDYKLDKEKIQLDLLEDLKKNDRWTALLQPLIPKCFDLVPKLLNDKAACKSGASQLMDCLAIEMYMGCPPMDWTESEDCNEEKKLIEECKKGLSRM